MAAGPRSLDGRSGSARGARPPGPWTRSWPATRARPRSPPSRWRCTMKMPTAAEVSELADVMLSHARPMPAGAIRGRRRRHRRHRRRRRQHRQPVHHGGDRGRRRGGAGGQARQPGGVVAVGRRRHAGGARGAHRPGARPGRAQSRRSRDRVLLRAAVSPVVPAHVRGAPRDRGAHGVQSPWAAYQSGEAAGRV